MTDLEPYSSTKATGSWALFSLDLFYAVIQTLELQKEKGTAMGEIWIDFSNPSVFAVLNGFNCKHQTMGLGKMGPSSMSLIWCGLWHRLGFSWGINGLWWGLHSVQSPTLGLPVSATDCRMILRDKRLSWLLEVITGFSQATRWFLTIKNAWTSLGCSCLRVKVKVRKDLCGFFRAGHLVRLWELTDLPAQWSMAHTLFLLWLPFDLIWVGYLVTVTDALLR